MTARDARGRFAKAAETIDYDEALRRMDAGEPVYVGPAERARWFKAWVTVEDLPSPAGDGGWGWVVPALCGGLLGMLAMLAVLR